MLLKKRFIASLNDKDPVKFKKLVDSQKNIDMVLDDHNGTNMLMLALDAGNTAAVRYILERGANPNATDNQGASPLNYVIRNPQENQIEVLDLLLEKGATLEGYNSSKSALVYAVSFDNFEAFSHVLQSLTDRDPETGKMRCDEDKQRYLKQRALMRAVGGNQEKFIESLLADGADANGFANEDVSPLIYAVENNAKQAVDLLLGHGADMDDVARYQQTALMRACMRGNAEIVASLVEYGCDVYARDQNGHTARDLAVKKGYYKIVQYLDDAIYPKVNGFRKVADDTVARTVEHMNGHSLTHTFNFTLQTMTTTFEDGEHSPAVETKPFRDVSRKAVQEAQSALKKMQKKP